MAPRFRQRPGPNELVEMFNNIGIGTKSVLGILAIASFYSWLVILSKISTFRKATSQTRKFIRAFRKASRLQEIASIASDCKASPLAQVFEDVYETYKRQTGGLGPPRNLIPLERSAQTAASEAVTVLERRMTWLATIGAVSPFCRPLRHHHGYCGRFPRPGSRRLGDPARRRARASPRR